MNFTFNKNIALQALFICLQPIPLFLPLTVEQHVAIFGALASLQSLFALKGQTVDMEGKKLEPKAPYVVTPDNGTVGGSQINEAGRTNR